MDWVICEECALSYPGVVAACPRCSCTRRKPAPRTEPNEPRAAPERKGIAAWFLLGSLVLSSLVGLGFFVLYPLLATGRGGQLIVFGLLQMAGSLYLLLVGAGIFKGSPQRDAPEHHREPRAPRRPWEYPD